MGTNNHTGPTQLSLVFEQGLAQRHMSLRDPAVAQAEAMANLTALAETLPALLAAAGLGKKK